MFGQFTAVMRNCNSISQFDQRTTAPFCGAISREGTVVTYQSNRINDNFSALLCRSAATSGVFAFSLLCNLCSLLACLHFSNEFILIVRLNPPHWLSNHTRQDEWKEVLRFREKTKVEMWFYRGVACCSHQLFVLGILCRLVPATH